MGHFIKVLCCILFSSFSFAQFDLELLKNTKEGTSFYNEKLTKDKRVAEQSLSISRIDDIFKNNVTSAENAKCTFTLVQNIKKEVLSHDPQFEHFEGFFYSLRSRNLLDDVSLGSILMIHQLEDSIYPPDSVNWNDISWIKNIEDRFVLLTNFQNSLSLGCFEDAYKMLLSKLRIKKIELTDNFLRTFFYIGYQEKRIDFRTYSLLENARRLNFERSFIPIKSYLEQKITVKKIQSQFEWMSLQDYQSNDVTKEFEKENISIRQKHFAKFDAYQMLQMAKVTYTLITRVRSNNTARIDFGDGDTVDLTPVEKFKITIKLFRKEVEKLNKNSFFSASAHHMDFILSAYELGVIDEDSFTELLKLEDIWNPEITFKQKALSWVKMFRPVVAATLGGPVGIAFGLALVIIELNSTGNKSLEIFE